MVCKKIDQPKKKKNAICTLMLGKLVSLLWTEHLGDSGNGGTTQEFLSPFLWRAPPLEMRLEPLEFFAEHAGKGSLLSS